MIDIIGHFFVLYPIITLNRDTSLFGRSTMSKLGVNMLIVAIAAFLTNFYLMDSNIISSGRREENLYEIFEVFPKDLVNFNATTLKHKYRDLSRKWHPDKNPDSSPEKFMKIKMAYELLNNPERRKMYDIYGQLDF